MRRPNGVQIRATKKPAQAALTHCHAPDAVSRDYRGENRAPQRLFCVRICFTPRLRGISARMHKTFELLAQDRQSKARHGRLTTAHGVIETPAFMPIGTQGSVKAVSPRELRELNAQIILGNTYHLFVRPGIEVIKHFGGLAQIHELGRAHPHRQRRLPNLFIGEVAEDH